MSTEPTVVVVTDGEGNVHWTTPTSKLAQQLAEPAVEVAEVTEPPRGGAGSGVDAWRQYATGQGVDLEDGMTRDDVIAAVELAKEAASDEAEPSEPSDDRDTGTVDPGPDER